MDDRTILPPNECLFTTTTICVRQETQGRKLRNQRPARFPDLAPRLLFRKRNNGRSEAKVHCFLATPSIPGDASLLKLRHEFLNSIFHFRALCSALVPPRFLDASVTLNPFKPSWALPSYVSLLQRTRESVLFSGFSI